ncbi:MAG: DUF3857 and transglutaminase domain-containing protein [Ferruginibacter sp.]
MNLRTITTVVACLCASHSFAQEQSTAKFGKLTPEDFKQTVYSLDSNANAIVLADIGSTEIDGAKMGELWLEYKRYKRIKILNKNGYDVANVEIGLYTNGRATEELKGLKAVTYNLENGKVTETKLDMDAGIFKDNINKHLVVKKFTFPNIKEGSIIEFEYKIKSDFISNVQPWDFQGQYPCLWSEYEVNLPEFYYYTTLSQGYQPYYIDTKEEKSGYYALPGGNMYQAAADDKFSSIVHEHRWVMKNVPPLKAEVYTSTIMNHLSRVEFHLSEYRYPYIARSVIGNWQELSEKMLKDDNFGYSLGRGNGWLGNEMSDAIKGVKDPMEKAKNIFTYVRDRMTCTDYDRIFTDRMLRVVLNSRSGSEAEINLILTAMLQKAGFAADPVMLSTRDHGYAMELYPILEKFNYIICKVKINDQDYLLDASHPMLGFGKLESDAYNGFAVVINEEATPFELATDAVLEPKVSSVNIINDEKGNLTGTMKQSPGFFESYKLRKQIKEKGKENFFNELKKDFNAEIEMKDPTIESLDSLSDPIAIQYDFDIKLNKEDILYINPMFSEALKVNPFKSAERTFPVEMPYTIDETYLLRMDIPAGYVVDELPKPIMVNLNDNADGFFEYVLSESDGAILLRSR